MSAGRCISGGKGPPVLLRQYAKIGGRLLGFNVDRKFSNCLHGLALVDLRRTDPEVLDRCMGRAAAWNFRKNSRSKDRDRYFVGRRRVISFGRKQT